MLGSNIILSIEEYANITVTINSTITLAVTFMHGVLWASNNEIKVHKYGWCEKNGREERN